MNYTLILLIALMLCMVYGSADAGEGEIKLPEPSTEGDMSLERTLDQRRSVRSYGESPLSLEELSQLLWAAQGITKRMEKPGHWPESREWFGGFRTAPSAGALYPLEVYVAAGEVGGLAKGLYKYDPLQHSLEKVISDDLRGELADASLGQSWVRECAADIIITAVYARTEKKYGERSELYVPVEVGAVMQNIHLQCEPLGLGTVIIGAFEDEKVAGVLDLPAGERPMGIMPVGRKKGN